MKKRFISLALIAIFSAMLITACTQPEAINTPVEESIVEDALPEETEQISEPEEVEITEPEAPEAEANDEDAVMEAFISEKIQDCHMLNFILGQTKTADEWSVTIDRMIGKGADINPEEKEMIINWLVSRNE